MIRIIKPYLKYRNINRKFRKIFKTGFFTKGEYVEQFQNDLKNYIECDYSFLTTSATTALSLSLELTSANNNLEELFKSFK